MQKDKTQRANDIAANVGLSGWVVEGKIYLTYCLRPENVKKEEKVCARKGWQRVQLRYTFAYPEQHHEALIEDPVKLVEFLLTGGV